MFKCLRVGRSERTSPPPFLYQATLLAFHTATWAPFLWPGSYFSLGYHLLKTDFKKHCCPGTALSINQTEEIPLFTTPHSWQSIHYPPKLPVYLQTVSWGLDKAVDKQSQTGVETDTQTLNFPLTFNHISFVVAVIVAVCGPVVNVEALDWSVVVTRGTILDGHGKKIRLRYSNLGDNYYTKRGNF